MLTPLYCTILCVFVCIEEIDGLISLCVGLCLVDIADRDVWNRFLLWLGFLKKSDSVQNEFGSVRFKKRSSVQIL